MQYPLGFTCATYLGFKMYFLYNLQVYTTPNMIFSVTYYLELRNTITNFCASYFLPTKVELVVWIFYFFLLLRQKPDKPTSKQRRGLTTWQVFRQVERRFYS